MFPMRIKLVIALLLTLALTAAAAPKPNIILILADDLGFGDTGCYGATKIPTPNIDRLGRESLRFTDAHATSATCTPSRYSLLTGQYPWRKKGTGILPGDAPLIIDTHRATLASILKKAGYHTGVVGKWHLGLGGPGGADWNGDIRPGPLEIGFDYSFIMAATGDRVPCVYIENHRVVGLDPKDPIRVSYAEPVGHDSTGRDHPELLSLKPSYGHDGTIVDGISRIGFMTGGQSARWKDQDRADTLTHKAVDFIEHSAGQPFFLYFATHDPHVPRVPHPRFVGKSGCGVRGDVIVEFDWCVGEILATLNRLHLSDNTIVIVTSDNGPVVDDGYADGAEEDLHGHRPAGPLRGGKYSIYEGGTRVPFILSWPGRVAPGVSSALICLMDLPASFAALTGQTLAPGDAPDSRDVLPALLGQTPAGRDKLVEHDGFTLLGLREGLWKYISDKRVDDNKPAHAQLYELESDLGEKHNVLKDHAAQAKEMSGSLDAIRATTPAGN